MSELARWGLSSAGWAVFGLLVGYLLGRLSRDLRRLANAAEHEEGTTPVTAPRRWPRLSGQTVLVVVVVALGIVTVIQGLVSSHDTQQLNQCIVRYSNGFADALDARSRSSDDSQRALDHLLATVGTQLSAERPNDRERISAALQDYQQKRRMANQLRSQHPLPAPPRDACNQ